MLNNLDLFSGIGGITLGLEWTNHFQTVVFCENDLSCHKVLNKHWPNIPIYKDVKELTLENLKKDKIPKIDIITGGFPCQDISIAGKGKGIKASRSGLWSEMCRLIDEIRPQYAIMENVSALLFRGLECVLSDLAKIGYDAEWHCIPASTIGAPHQRDRIWIITYPNNVRNRQYRKSSIKRKHRNRQERKKMGGLFNNSNTTSREVSNTTTQRLQRKITKRERPEESGLFTKCSWWKTEPNVGRVVNGIPTALGRTIRRYGYEDVNIKKAITKIDLIRKSILQEMWCKQNKVEPTSYRVKTLQNNYSLHEMSYLRAYEEWKLGERIKENKDLCDMWEYICSKSFKKTQVMQQKMLVRIREIECNEKVASDIVDRLRQLGNSVVPQIPYLIGLSIIEMETNK